MATIEQNLTQLVQDRDNLVTNLTTKGITGLTGDETFTELVPEVLNIPSGENIYDYFIDTLTDDDGVADVRGTIKRMPFIDTTEYGSFSSFFRNAVFLIEVPQINTSNGDDFSAMFSGCINLTEIPQIDTSNGENFAQMFAMCNKLTSIPQLDMSSGIKFTNMLQNCNKLTTLGGFVDIGKAYLTSASANYSNYTLTLSSCNELTHESLMNVINNLYDIASAGVQTQKLVLGSTNLAKLSADEIAIATNKGWAVS